MCIRIHLVLQLADALFLICFLPPDRFSGFWASASAWSYNLRMHFSCLACFGRIASLDFGHPHPASLLLCGCTFLVLLASAGSFLWILGIRIPPVCCIADARMHFSSIAISDCARAARRTCSSSSAQLCDPPEAQLSTLSCMYCLTFLITFRFLYLFSQNNILG